MIVKNIFLFLLLFFSISFSSEVYVIGDSLTVSVKRCLEKKINNITVDGKVGRQFSELPSVIEKHKILENRNCKLVVISLGTNGPINRSKLESIIEKLKQKNIEVVLVTNTVPRNWEESNNKLIYFISSKYNTVVVDWKYYVSTHKDENLLTKDKVHLTEHGRRVFCNLIVESISSSK